MAQMPYSPMRGPEKLVTQEDMWTRLAKHAPAEVEIHRQKAAQTPKAEPAVALLPLEWHKPEWTGPPGDRHRCGFILSLCGRFSITRERVHGGEMYEAWRRKDPAHESIPLGIRSTKREAEHLCELKAADEQG